MNIQPTPIKDLIIIKPDIYEDERGYFFESYNFNKFSKHSLPVRFVQDNESLSQKGVLRGLHFQNPPFAQAKLVRAIKGAILDIVVDLRKSSESYGQHFSIQLNEKNKQMLYIPEGFAHGFVTLEDQTLFSYKCSNFYNKDAENTISWNDPDLKIDWQVKQPILSEKDNRGVPFNTYTSPF
ncbi:MAG TPA: dTDP-4-dehydrorhamnose 3,5-epimerase [Flavobacteriales bacterium]|nr:dTDP-4-dehydrorhamnose 3,5-epimerase [Flavobacteriales bacterium]HIN40527.1 dTDP-4-dehydrorhamnose 3,5-epimerase [Flavobacteriales bacterium]